MRIITLRIDDEEKARLEQLAERGNVTLSRALREGAALYLHDVQAKLHRSLGGGTTWHGLRRDKNGRVINEETVPTRKEQAGIESLRQALQESALGTIRDAYLAGEDSRLIIGALGQWLNLVGLIYAGNETDVGWSWFVADYCAGFATKESRDQLRRAVRTGLVATGDLDVGALVESLEQGFGELLADVERQDAVRRAVLPAWRVLEAELA
jgi:predicted transcriptional regulator